MRRYILLVAARAFICAFAYPSDTTQATQSMQAGKRERERAAECERAGERALYSVWFDSNLFDSNCATFMAVQHV